MDICSIEQCTACWACREICPKSCIEIIQDELSAEYPFIKTNECINCGLCSKICPNNVILEFHIPKAVYAAWSKDDRQRQLSASGGVASELYKYYFSIGGFSAGVIYDFTYGAHYIPLQNISDINEVQNSKYTYSNTNGIFAVIKKKLEEKIPVLFIGLPCQVAGLLGFLRKPYENLVTVDIICHGVAPSEYLRQHINKLETQKKQHSTKVYFRDPKYKTNRFYFTLYNENVCFYKKPVYSDDLYQIGYHKALNYRENCYSCKYARRERISDLTIGDFSGLGRSYECDFNRANVSCLIVNTTKGEEIIHLLSERLTFIERPMCEAFDYEKQLNSPSIPHMNRKVFVNAYKQSQSYNYAAKIALSDDIFHNRINRLNPLPIIRKFISFLIPYKIRRQIKRIIGGHGTK